MLDNGDWCPQCKQNQMPKWNSPSETARKCQECGVVEERGAVKEVMKIREKGYYWIEHSAIGLIVAEWNGRFWLTCGNFYSSDERDIEIKGKVIEGEWKE